MKNRRWGAVCAFAILIVTAGLWKVRTVSGDDWLPISPEELKMTSVPEAPGAPAVILFRQVDRDDETSREINYVRIKILNEEGRKYADISIPFVKGSESIQGLKARTIRPDGSIVNFDGKMYDKEIVKARGVKYLARSLSLPDVQPGGIIEYRYANQMDENQLYSSHWILSEELFTKHAKFSLKPYSRATVRFNWQGLPEGVTPTNGSIIRLEVNNIVPFRTEDFMPPENELKARVDFLYSRSDEKDPVKFWKAEGKQLNEVVESFVDRQSDLARRRRQTQSDGTSGFGNRRSGRHARNETAENLHARAEGAQHHATSGEDRAGAEASEGKRKQQCGRRLEARVRQWPANQLAVSESSAGRRTGSKRGVSLFAERIFL
jgi:hypothetical protein